MKQSVYIGNSVSLKTRLAKVTFPSPKTGKMGFLTDKCNWKAYRKSVAIDLVADQSPRSKDQAKIDT